MPTRARLKPFLESAVPQLEAERTSRLRRRRSPSAVRGPLLFPRARSWPAAFASAQGFCGSCLFVGACASRRRQRRGTAGCGQSIYDNAVSRPLSETPPLPFPGTCPR
jgi:hypothetical protein